MKMEIAKEEIRNTENEQAEMPILTLDDITNIKYEAVRDFHNSIFYDTYAKAVEITREIVRKNDALWGDGFAKGIDGTVLRNREQICNVIFFTGDRGTGKTSTMLSYMEFLKDYYNVASNNPQMLGNLYFGSSQYMFTGLEYIDASSLNDKEDILGIVLSKMLKKWNDEEMRSHGRDGIVRKDDYDYRKRQLRLQFNQVYDRLRDLRSQKDITQMDSDMYLETLERLSFTGNLKQSFQKLVKGFLDIMCYPGSEREITDKNHFLVISIDDLDLNISHGFMMLEQIRNYLMVPNVIVLLSASYDQLEKVCYNHYMGQFKNSQNSANLSETCSHVARLAREYLEKMVPIQRQVRFTPGRKWEFFDKRPLAIRVSDQIMETGTLYEIIKNQMRHYFGAYFAPGGKCLYYLTPDTLREACNWFNQIYASAAIDTKWFLSVEMPRLCHKYLKSDLGNFLDRVDEFEPEQQVQLVKMKFGKLGVQQEGRSLLEIFAGAIQGDLEMQHFVSINMIYFTVKLSGLGYAMVGNSEREKAARMKFLKYFSDGDWGVWGAWEEKFLSPIAARSGTGAPKFYRIARNEFKNCNNCLNIDLSMSGEFALDQKNVGVLQNYQYLLLFYKLNLEGARDANLWTSTKRSNEIQLKLSNNFRGVFSLSGFVLNLLDGAELVKKFIEELPRLLAQKGGYNSVKEVKAAMNQTKVSIIPQLEKLGVMGGKLLPLDSIEYLVYAGRAIQNRLGRCVFDGDEDNQIRLQIKNYTVILEETLQDFGEMYGETTICQRYRDLPLTKKMKGEENGEFLGRMVKAIKEHRTLYNPKAEELEWSGVDYE